MKILKRLSLLLVVFGLVGCMSDAQFKEKLVKVLKENPEILGEAIQEKPADFLESFQKAVRKAQGEMAQRRAEEEKKELEKSFENPLNPKFRDDESFRGSKDAPITIVEYSDFECPYCARGYQTVKNVMKKYDGKVRFVYKHLPLSFHKNAMVASQMYEAIRLQSPEKAFKFHDDLYENAQNFKSGGVKYLEKVAKGLGVNMSQVKKDMESDKVKNRIQEDIKEANSFGIQGTPGFILNGVPLKGALPVSEFVRIIDELKKRGKLKI